jgi:hypothetical protein
MYEIDGIIEEIIEEIGTDAIVINTDDIAAIECGGMLVDQPQPTSDILKAILDCYDLIVRHDNGVLTFLQRGNEDQIVIDADDLSAHEPGRDVDKLYSITDPSDINLPREVIINFIDPTNEWQKSAVGYRKPVGITNETQSFNMPFTMYASAARYIARRRCLSYFLCRKSISIFLPPKYITLRENDILLIPDGDEYIVMRIENITRGLNYLLEIKGKIDNGIESAFDIEAEDKDTEQTLSFPVPVGFIFIDICSLSDAYIDKAGYYAAAFSLDPDRSFNGAFLYDDITNVLSFTSGATAGYAVDALGSANGYTWDRVNKVTVELCSGSLESVTVDECLAGANRTLIGDEIIGFQTATLTGTNTYELSNLIRGLGDTRDAIDSHEAKEGFLLLEASKLKFRTINNNQIGVEKSFKILSPGQSFDSVTAIAQTPNAYNLRPFAPCFIRGSRDGSGNLTIEWCRRTRSIVKLLTELPIPLSEETEAYEIDIMAGEDVLRTIEATEESCQYSAAQQTADGLTPGDSVTVRIYQISAIVGRGKYGEKIL